MGDDPKADAPSPAPAPPQEADALMKALWARALEAWDDEKPHHALLDYAIREQKLPELAGLYRALKDGDAEKAARAQKKLDGIVIAATHMLMAMKTPAEQVKVPLSVTLTAFAVSFLLLGWLVYAMFRRH